MLGKYVPIATLGAGGMGRADLALSLEPKDVWQLVVLKRLKLETPVHDRAVCEEALRWEAYVSSLVHHPNVAQTIDLDVIEGELVMSVEYLEGVTVRDMAMAAEAAGTVIPRRILVRVVVDALAGLACAHDLEDEDGAPYGIVHRDVSPSNIAVTADGTTKVLDFGVAKAKGSCGDTPPGIVKGKLRYMAPEQLLGEGVDRRADVFAMGMVLWEGLAGARIGDVESSLEARVMGACPSVRAVRADVPHILADIVGWCLARDPADRPADAATLAAHLLPFAGTRDEVSAWVRWNFGAMLEGRRRDVARIRSSLTMPPRAARPPSRWARYALVAACAVFGALLTNLGCGGHSAHASAPVSHPE